MIISHFHKFMFIAIPKTGTHTIRFALRDVMHKDDWEQVGLFVKREFPIPEIAKIKHGHIKATEIKPHLEETIWNSYFKFAFVRNPFDRFVSLFFFFNKKQDFTVKEANHAMHHLIENDELFSKRVHYNEQGQFVCDKQNNLMVDFIGRVEEFKESFDQICEIIGIPPFEIEKSNTSQHDTYKKYYDESLKIKVTERFKNDIEIFDYSF